LRAKLIQAVFAAKKKPTGAGVKSANQSGEDEVPTDQDAPTTQRLVAEEDRWDRIDIYCAARGGRLTKAASRNQSTSSDAEEAAGDAQKQ
jgi:hypothetical protein